RRRRNGNPGEPLTLEAGSLATLGLAQRATGRERRDGALAFLAQLSDSTRLDDTTVLGVRPPQRTSYHGNVTDKPRTSKRSESDFHIFFTSAVRRTTPRPAPTRRGCGSSAGCLLVALHQVTDL